MALVDSLLSAIVRADGDALVMHVGERPYVVVGLQTINISTHGLNLEAMTGMLTQLLPGDAQTQLEEFGAVEYRIPQQGDDRFSVVAARGGDDIWIEIRRRRPAAAAQPKPSAPEPHVAVADAAPPPIETPLETPPAVPIEPAAEPIAEPIAEDPPAPSPEPISAPAAEVAPEPSPVLAHEMPAAPIAAPELTQAPSEHVEAAPAVYDDWIAAAIERLEPVSEAVATAEASMAEVVGPPLEQPVPETTFVEATVDRPMIAALEEPILEVIDEEEVVAVTEAAVEMSAFTEATVDRPAFTEAAIHQPAPESHPLMAASIESHRSEASELELPRVDAPPPAPPATEPGVVLPLTRTVRIEVPPRTVPVRAASAVDRLLRIAASRGATALFLTSESRPWMRLEGDLRYLDSETPLSRADVESAILEIAPESGQEAISRGEAAEWIAEFENVGRVRCTTFTDHRGPGVLLRMIATRAATAEQLGLAHEVQALATESQGLVLVAGPRASGKSTLLSALVDLVNRQRAEYVITLERQVRLVHDNKQALVSQREIRGAADESVAAVRAAVRENPDVLVVDDLVSPAMVPLLLTAAADGLLIFVSITAPSTADAVARFAELAPPEMRKAVQNAMAESFRGAVGQILVKKAAGGLLAAREVLLESGPVTRAISEGQFAQLPLALESGRKHGMVSFNDALVDFVRAGTVDVREAFRKAHDRQRLLESLKGSGVDTSVVGRLV